MQRTLQGREARYRLRLVQASPFIYVRDLQPTPGLPKEWSLKPRRRDEPEDIQWVLERILDIGDGPWDLPRQSAAPDVENKSMVLCMDVARSAVANPAQSVS